MEQTKPTVELTNATDCGGFLLGVVYGHPTLGKKADGRMIQTSGIVKRDGNTVETRNTIYKVTSWATEPTQETKIATKEPEAQP